MARWIGVWALAAFVVVTLAACEVPLGTLGGAVSNALDISDSGVIVGTSSVSPDNLDHAFIRRPGTSMTALTPVPGFQQTQALGVNNASVAVGLATSSTDDNNPGLVEALRWNTDGSVDDLGNLGDNFAEAEDINDAGVIVGESAVFDSNGVVKGAAFLFDPTVGHMIALPLPSGMTASDATAINRDGLVVGSGQDPAGTVHAVKWDAQTHAATVLDAGPLGSVASGINASGTIVGNDGFQAVLWPAGSTVLHALVSPIPNSVSVARDINDAGEAVGVAVTANLDSQAVFWDASGVGTELSVPTPGKLASCSAIANGRAPVGQSQGQATIFSAPA
jgi:uncharacterized membrane protein